MATQQEEQLQLVGTLQEYLARVDTGGELLMRD